MVSSKWSIFHYLPFIIHEFRPNKTIVSGAVCTGILIPGTGDHLCKYFLTAVAEDPMTVIVFKSFSGVMQR